MMSIADGPHLIGTLRRVGQMGGFFSRAARFSLSLDASASAEDII